MNDENFEDLYRLSAEEVYGYQPTDEELAAAREIAVGDTVAYLSKPDAKGFRVHTTAEVRELVDDLLVVHIKTLFAYHPDNPKGGRHLPIAKPWTFQGKSYDPSIDVIEKSKADLCGKF
jgi:hypothetical protein